MSSRESSSMLSNSVSIRNTFFFVSSFSPIVVVAHRHEDDPSFELLWFTLWFSHHLLNLVENSQWSESLGNFSTRTPSAPRRSDQNLWDNVFPKTNWSCFSMLRLVHHWYLPDIARSQKRRKFWQLQIEQLCQLKESSLSTQAAANQWL